MSGPFQIRWRMKQRKDPTIDVDVGLENGSKVPKSGQQSGITFQRRSAIQDAMHPHVSEGGVPEIDDADVANEVRNVFLAGPKPRESYKDAMRNTERHWDNAFPSMEQAAITYTPHISQQWKYARDAEVNRISAMIQSYEDKSIHHCAERGDDCMEMAEAAVGMPSHDGGTIHMEESKKGGSSQLSYVGERLVVYRGFRCSSTIKVPIFRCPHCGDFEMLALFSACTPFSPIKPRMWV